MPRRKRYTQREIVLVLEGHGWKQATGGKHQVKMTKPGHRPITVPLFRGETLPVGLSQAILRQADIEET